MEKISVAVRFRPETSIASAGDRRWRIEDNRISLHGPPGSPLSGASFAFDHVFDSSTTNAAVYDLLVKSIIDSTINGFNGTTFAYGQTNSGKTYTMNGSKEDPGIIQMAVGDIFNNIKMIEDRDFMFRVSYMEIYNEEINDLLSLGGERLEIHESLERGVYVAGLQEEVVNDAEQVLQLIKLGEANRRFGETNMNARSSRSHTIFRMVIESSTKESISSRNIQSVDAIRVSILNLVDLAGSERVAKTGADGVRLKEGKYINKSLMILGNVINKLSDCGKQRGHIPYRDSKLTRILQSALGGNAKTSIICTVAPEELHIEETKGTLQFASRAKRITNCAQVNEILTDAVLLKRQRIEIEELRRKLQGSNFELLEEVILKHRNDMLKSELENEKLAMELNEKKKYCQILEEQVKEQKRLIENLGSFSSDQNMSLKEGADIDGDRLIKSDCFQTPDMKITSGDFVVRRRDQSMLPDSSPIPEITETVADEDVWLQLNNGHTTDLDLLQMTPNLKPNSSLSNTLLEHPMAVEKSPFSKFKCSRRVELIESSMKQRASLEEENSILKEEKASLEQALSWSYENEKLLEREMEELRKELNLNMQKMSDLEEKASFSSLSDEKVKVLEREKEELLEELNMERQKMTDLTGQIRLFSVEFARRDKQLVSLHSKSKAMVESFRTCPVPKPAQTEC